ncbi:MAG: DUF5069 domain-containing protein [Opitutales bacterium]|nr:DUF5069 domain-containing protein [Opitutales bacterium]
MSRNGRPNTGEIHYDLPSPYIPHANGLLHLPRFIAKAKRYAKGELGKSYLRNYKRGFDRFLCLHLGVDPDNIEDIVRSSSDDEEIERRLEEILPENLEVAKWHRELVQKGMSERGRETLEQTKRKMGIADRDDLISFADMIEFDEERITPKTL